jgi:hypothetical protein
MITGVPFMLATFARTAARGPIHIPTRVADMDVPEPCAGDFATVLSIGGDIEYCVRLKASAGPLCWRGDILSIGREGGHVRVAQGLELDDVVEIYQSEITSLIRCQLG